MHSARLIVILLASGAMAGAVFGAASSALAGPYLEGAIMLEAQGIERAGVPEEAYWSEYAEYAEYREWQGRGAMLASVVLGCAFAAVYGIVYILYGKHLPGRGNAAKAFVLAGAMLLTIYAVPAAKYPPGLPGDGDASTLDERTLMHLGLVAISGVSAIVLHHASLGWRGAKKAPFAVAWVAIVVAAMAIMPSSPDTPSSSQASLDAFRAASAVAMAAYWVSLPAIFGVLWRRFGHDARIWAQQG